MRWLLLLCACGGAAAPTVATVTARLPDSAADCQLSLAAGFPLADGGFTPGLPDGGGDWFAEDGASQEALIGATVNWALVPKPSGRSCLACTGSVAVPDAGVTIIVTTDGGCAHEYE